jgi:HSP20 family protein
MARDLIRLMQSLFLPVAEMVREPATWQPCTDVTRTPYGWLIKFELAGVRPEDLELSVQHGRTLILRGTRRDWFREEGCCHYLMEIAYSRFERRITLPTAIDLGRADIRTEFRQGLLLVRIFSDNYSSDTHVSEHYPEAEK